MPWGKRAPRPRERWALSRNFSAIAYSEAIIDHIVRFINLCFEQCITSTSAKEEAYRLFKADNSARMPETIWVTGCQSWYLNEEGEPENWTGTPDEFRELLREPDLDDFIVRRADARTESREPA